MEKKLLKGLFGLCVVLFPFAMKRSALKEVLIIFLGKGVISTLMDVFYVRTKRIAYPVRPLPHIYKTNILYDFLFFPLLSVFWIRQCYKDRLPMVLLKSLTWSVPMSIGQWYLEKTTNLFHWKRWTIFHTFGCVTFTLLAIRGLIEMVKRNEHKSPIEEMGS
ncbi:CBO0543 family protein [Metabacillus sp. SLBN-84]